MVGPDVELSCSVRDFSSLIKVFALVLVFDFLALPLEDLEAVETLELVESVERARDLRGDLRAAALPRESPDAARRRPRRVGVDGAVTSSGAEGPTDDADASVPTEEARVRRFLEDCGISDSAFLGVVLVFFFPLEGIVIVYVLSKK